MEAKAVIAKLFSPFRQSKQWLRAHLAGVLSFGFAFVLMTTFIDITLSRNAAIRNIKSTLAGLTANLNEMGLDIAYDQIEFNSIFIYPLLEIDNLQLYNLKGRALWSLKFANISGRPGWFSTRRLKLRSDDGADISLNGTTYHLDSSSAKALINLSPDYQLQELEVHVRGNQIKDIAKIQDLTIALRRMHNTSLARTVLPSFEGHLELKGITFNGLLNYPLSSEIKRAYAKFNLMGSLAEGETFMLAAENWLHSGGFIEVPSLFINWPPLLLVGRGDINFDENFAPKVQLHTSSKALLELLNDLQEKSYLDKKGVFVANILLGAKSFKMHDDDKYLTLTTPITYRDHKLAIENITVRSFAPQNGQ